MSQTKGSLYSSTTTVRNIEDVLNTILDVQNSLSAVYEETSLKLKNAFEPMQLFVPELKKNLPLPQLLISEDSSSRQRQAVPIPEPPSERPKQPSHPEKPSPQQPKPSSKPAKPPSQSPTPSTSSPKWMLKHQGPGSGLTELMPNTGIYVSEVELTRCNLIKTDMRKFGRLFLPVVFSKEALQKCSFSGRSKLDRPAFDEHAKNAFMDYVTKHAKESGWEIVSRQSLMQSLNSKINSLSKYHFKYSPINIDF